MSLDIGDISRELVVLVEGLREIGKDGGRLKDVEPVVGDGGDAAVGVDLNTKENYESMSDTRRKLDRYTDVP